MYLNGENLQLYLPAHLTDKEKGKMAKVVSDFGTKRKSFEYFQPVDPSMTLQGDCVEDVNLFDYNTLEISPRKAMVLSNTCDISTGNERRETRQVTVAPILTFRGIRQLWKASGASDESVDAALESVENQYNTTYFYLPPTSWLSEKTAVCFSLAQSLPMPQIQSEGMTKSKLSLSQVGFWLLSLKLSMHFCRLHEGVHRNVA